MIRITGAGRGLAPGAKIDWCVDALPGKADSEAPHAGVGGLAGVENRPATDPLFREDQ